MAPVDSPLLKTRVFNLYKTGTLFKDEWVAPSNYAFTILLLLGGDVVAKALAQLVGGPIAPVAFSFGMSSSFEPWEAGRVSQSRTPEDQSMFNGKLNEKKS